MVKTLPEREFDSFREILKGYFEYLDQNPNSLISRFYGLHKMTWTDLSGEKQTIYLVVMNNIFVDFKVGLRFDLKGSVNNRTVLKGEMKPTDLGPIAMKDNDFRIHMGSINLFDKNQGKKSLTAAPDAQNR